MKKLLLKITTLFTVLGLVGCGTNWEIEDNATSITVAASVTPHSEILRECIPLMEEKGYTLKVKEFTDYILPNTATEDGSVQGYLNLIGIPYVGSNIYSSVMAQDKVFMKQVLLANNIPVTKIYC